MKVAVLNYSGNVGKSTVAGQLLHPRMGNAPVFSIESLNVDASGDGVEVARMKGRKFGDLMDQMMRLDDAIVDVGASNIEDFLKLMQQYSESHEEFDYFVVPVVKGKKQQADTVNTVRALSALGISQDKIRLLFNKVELDDVIEDEFAPLFGLADLENSFTIRPEAAIYTNEVFERLKALGKSVNEITSDPVDYRERMRHATDEDEKEHCIRMVALKRLGATANRNLDAVFAVLFT